MIVLTDEQVTSLIRLLTAVQTGENYRIAEVDDAIDMLSRCTTINCPFQDSFSASVGTALAKEIIAALTGKAQQ